MELGNSWAIRMFFCVVFQTGWMGWHWGSDKGLHD